MSANTSSGSARFVPTLTEIVDGQLASEQPAQQDEVEARTPEAIDIFNLAPTHFSEMIARREVLTATEVPHVTADISPQTEAQFAVEPLPQVEAQGLAGGEGESAAMPNDVWNQGSEVTAHALPDFSPYSVHVNTMTPTAFAESAAPASLRVLPVLEETVEPSEWLHGEASSDSLAAPVLTYDNPLRSGLPNDFEEQLVHRVMQRVDAVLIERVGEVIASVIEAQTRSLLPSIREELEFAVRKSVYEAMADELSELQQSSSTQGPSAENPTNS